MKKIYIAAQSEKNKKYYSFVINANISDDLISILNNHNIKVARIFLDEEEANQRVRSWNAINKANSNYIFDSPKF